MAEMLWLFTSLAVGTVVIGVVGAAAEAVSPGSIKRLEEALGFGSEPEWRSDKCNR
mgnify:CR=1 FL=1